MKHKTICGHVIPALKYWRGYGLNIPMSKTDSCAHTKNNHPDNECYTQLMIKHVFGLINDDACVNCSSYKPKRENHGGEDET